jgi:hypothetical protein
MFRVIRITVANVQPLTLATELAKRGHANTCTATVGAWTDSKGVTMVEQGACAEWVHADVSAAWSMATTLCNVYGEQCVYVTLDGQTPHLVYANGDIEEVTG